MNRPEPFYQQSIPDVSARLSTDAGRGLTEAEAGRRLLQYGPNELDVRRTRSWLRVLFEQFLSPLVWVLAAAAGLAFSFGDWLEGAAILSVIFINAVIGFSMEWQANRSMEALRRLVQSHAKVFRDGKLRRAPTAELVPGDLVFLEAGDMVPADGRVVQMEKLGLREAALTGESTMVEKQTDPLPGPAPLHDRRNMVFKGTVVSRGNARIVVTATGGRTELGAIARLVESAEKEATPLERKLARLSQRLLWVTLLLALIILGIGLLQGRDPYLMIKTAVALAVAAIPEGLPIVATIALARGMLRLARHRVIVKKLSAVETLGATQVICTDKTGTLTENHLTADTLIFAFERLNLPASPPAPPAGEADFRGAAPFRQLCRVGALCNNAVQADDPGKGIGDPLEIALLTLAADAGHPPAEQRKTFPRLRELPFDSDTKMMGTLHRRPEGGFLACIKGAPEVVLPESDFELLGDGALRPLDNRDWWREQADELAARGLRTLALAYAELDEEKEDFFRALVLVAVVGFLDPPREEIRPAMQQCREAGVRVIMVTGDHPATARHIAFRTGLADDESTPAVLGDEIGAGGITNEAVLRTAVFARVSPAQKLQLVTLLQQQGLIVGMTGDGVNDTPALKKADIGIAMGQRGTEAAREVADLVLEDDAFTSIVLAIRQGRGIFDNIRHFVVYLLSCNLSELLVVSVAALSNLGVPLLPLQILFLNMVTDVFPALALGMNRESPDVMRRPPRPGGESIVNTRSWRAVAVYATGLTLGAVGILLFSLYRLRTTGIVANNLVFYTLVLAQLWHVFNLPDRFFNSEVVRNRYIWMALAICLLLIAAAYAIPLVRTVLQLQPLDASLLGWVFAFSLLPVVFIQFFKWLKWV